MSRRDRRLAAKRAKGREEKKLVGWQFAVMALVTFAMVCSSFAPVFSYGGPWLAVGIMVATVALAFLAWYVYQRRRAS